MAGLEAEDEKKEWRTNKFLGAFSLVLLEELSSWGKQEYSFRLGCLGDPGIRVSEKCH